MARPKKKEPGTEVLPLIVLSKVYTSRIGNECLELFEIIDKAASRSVDYETRRELAVVAQRLARMGEMFV